MLRMLWCIALLGATGCLEAGESSFPAQEFADLGAPEDMGFDPDAGARLEAGEGAGTMTGTWLLVHENSLCVLNQEQVSVSEYLVEIDQSGPTLRESRRLCVVVNSPVLGVAINIPESVTSSVVFPEQDRGYVSSLEVGGGYGSSLELALWGVELANPVEDPLPTAPDDPTVRDSDGDGQPGVSFVLGNDTCRRYVAQRQFISYQGLFTAPNVVEGSSVAFTETNVLDGTSGVCRTAPPLVPNDGLNRFKMVRVDGEGGAFDADADGDGAITCEEVRGLGVELIAGREPNRDNCR